MTDVTVLFESEPGRRGSWCSRTRTIRICPKQLQVERRETAAHERIHAERHHAGCQDPREELSVRKQVARELIHIRDLGDAVKWTDDEHELADELWVTVEMLRLRVQYLHPGERGFLRRIVAARAGGA